MDSKSLLSAVETFKQATYLPNNDEPLTKKDMAVILAAYCQLLEDVIKTVSE